MTRRANRLLLLALVVISFTMYYGCSQTDDIVTPVSESRVTLTARHLPTLPDGMVYEIWLVGDGDSVSIDQFTYDNETKTYMTAAGDPRPDGNVFRFDGDVLAYEEMFVAVQNPAVDPVGSPGAIMLWDIVTNPKEDAIYLKFPMLDSLWLSTMEFNMRTPSDTNRSANNGAGLWFSQYILRPESLADTLGLQGPDSFSVETLFTDTANNDSGYTSIAGYEDAFIETVLVVFGFDSLQHIRTDFGQTIFSHDSEAPYRVINVVPNWIIGPTSTFDVDLFFQQEYGLIEYAGEFGWTYKGWVVSPVIDAAGASLGSLTPPAWDAVGQGLMPGHEGGLITTGRFDAYDSADFGNPYTDAPRVPPVPGEDFFSSLPNSAPDTLNLVPGPGTEGTVFITLEPLNYTDTTTNFPLILYIGEMPSSPSQLDLQAGQNDDLQQFFPMIGYMMTNSPTQGFPSIWIDIERE